MSYSPLHFEIAVRILIVIEVLAVQISCKQSIKGVCIDSAETKLSISADDLTVFTANKTSFDKLMKVLEEFRVCSGLKINKEKTEEYWLGKATQKKV